MLTTRTCASFPLEPGVPVPHPRMYDPGDPPLHRLRELCLTLPGASEAESHGHPVFRTKKIFAVYGGMTKGGEGVSVRYPQSVLLKADEDDLRRLLEEEGFFLPAYYGPYGWIGMDLSREPVEWDTVRELVEDSFRQTAPRKLVLQLDD